MLWFVSIAEFHISANGRWVSWNDRRGRFVLVDSPLSTPSSSYSAMIYYRTWSPPRDPQSSSPLISVTSAEAWCLHASADLTEMSGEVPDDAAAGFIATQKRRWLVDVLMDVLRLNVRRAVSAWQRRPACTDCNIIGYIDARLLPCFTVSTALLTDWPHCGVLAARRPPVWQTGRSVVFSVVCRPPVRRYVE